VEPGVVFGSGGWLEPRGMTSASTSGRITFTWGGRDARGRFRSTSLPVDLPPVNAPVDAEPGEVRIVPRVLTRALAVIARCWMIPAQGNNTSPRPECHELIVAPNHRAPRLLGDVANLVGSPLHLERYAHLQNAMALPDGGALLRIQFAPAYRHDVVLRLDARGNVIARRGFAFAANEVLHLLAIHDGEPGFAVATHGTREALTFYRLDGHDEGRPLRVGLADHPSPCSTAASSRPYLLIATPAFNATYTIDFAPIHVTETAQVTVEIDSAGRACVRDAQTWTSDPQDANTTILARSIGAFAAHADHGRMSGMGIGRTAEGEVYCELRSR
jgi:hypothetical protein